MTVRFRPPGWRLEIAALGAAILLGLAWSLKHATSINDHTNHKMPT